MELKKRGEPALRGTEEDAVLERGKEANEISWSSRRAGGEKTSRKVGRLDGRFLMTSCREDSLRCAVHLQGKKDASTATAENLLLPRKGELKWANPERKYAKFSLMGGLGGGASFSYSSTSLRDV